MTVLMTMDLPASRADLEEVSASMDTHQNPPDGLIIHVATETADGVHVVDIWESRAAFEKFRDGSLVPTMQKYMAEHNMAPDSAPQPQLDEAFDVVRGR
jgi:heme-degrading monooxygenase HmoA